MTWAAANAFDWEVLRADDHPQHRGLTFAHADLNGFNYWADEPSNPGREGLIRVTL